jgi:hypothetical protein
VWRRREDHLVLDQCAWRIVKRLSLRASSQNPRLGGTAFCLIILRSFSVLGHAQTNGLAVNVKQNTGFTPLWGVQEAETFLTALAACNNKREERVSFFSLAGHDPDPINEKVYRCVRRYARSGAMHGTPKIRCKQHTPPSSSHSR